MSLLETLGGLGQRLVQRVQQNFSNQPIVGGLVGQAIKTIAPNVNPQMVQGFTPPQVQLPQVHIPRVQIPQIHIPQFTTTPKVNSLAYNLLQKMTPAQPIAQNFLNYINPTNPKGLSALGGSLVMPGEPHIPTTATQTLANIPIMNQMLGEAGKIKLPGKQIVEKVAPKLTASQFGAQQSIQQTMEELGGKAKGIIESAGQKERGFVTTVKVAKNTADEVAQKIKGFYNPVANKATIAQAQQAVAQSYDLAKQRVFNEPLSADTNAIGLELMRQAQNAKRFDEATQIAEHLATKGTEVGQAIQAFSIWSRLTPEGMLRYGVQQVDKAKAEMGFLTKGVRGILGKGDLQLTAEDSSQITSLMKKANLATSEQAKGQFTKQALEVINKKIPYGVSDWLDAYRYTNLLSNPLTHLRNMTSNALQTFLTRPLTLGVSGHPIQAIKYYGGVVKGFGEAVSDAADVFKGTVSLEKPDIRQLKMQQAPGIFKIIPNAMEASDKFFQALIRNGELAGGKSLEQANQVAKYSLFRESFGKNPNQGYLLKGIDNATQGVMQLGHKFPLVRWFVPFIATPMNIAKQWIEYSPGGLTTLPGATNKGEQLAKTLIGSVVTAMGAKLAFDGRTTWATPTDPKQKELFYASGRKPFSVLIGDKWIPMQSAGVFAFPLALAAAAKHYQEDSRTALTDTQFQKLKNAVLSQVDYFSQQTFMQGLGNFMSLVKGDKDYSFEGNVASASSQLIPFSGLMGYITRLIDPVFRKAQGFTQKLESQLPGLSQKLPAYTSPEGEIQKRSLLDSFLPYAVGQQNPQYEQPYQQRIDKLQENNVINQAKKEVSQTGNKTVTAGNNQFFIYTDELGNSKSIPLNRPIPQLNLTGQTELDKLAVSKYNSTVNTKIKDIQTLVENNQLTAQQGEQQIQALRQQQTAAKTKIGKGPKLKVAKKPKLGRMPRIKLGRARKLPKIKLAKGKKVKIPKFKPLKIPKIAGYRPQARMGAFV